MNKHYLFKIQITSQLLLKCIIENEEGKETIITLINNQEEYKPIITFDMNEIIIGKETENAITFFEDFITKPKEFKEYILFDLLSKKDLNSISKKIVNAINSDNNKFVYSAPLSQKLFSKLYQILKN